VLTAGQGSLLATELAAADASLGAPAVATSHLAEFARLVSTLVEASLLRPALGSELIADAVAIANRVDRYGRCDPPPPSLPPPG
jgi:hypothetical protein